MTNYTERFRWMERGLEMLICTNRFSSQNWRHPYRSKADASIETNHSKIANKIWVRKRSLDSFVYPEGNQICCREMGRNVGLLKVTGVKIYSIHTFGIRNNFYECKLLKIYKKKREKIEMLNLCFFPWG